MPIAEGIAAARLALDAATKALDLLRYPKIDGEQVRNMLIAMQDHILSAQRALGEADEENRQLRQQLDDREALKAIEADLELRTDDGGYLLRKSDGAFCCPMCWGERKLVVPLMPMNYGYYECTIHKSGYQTKAGKEELNSRNRRPPPRMPKW